MAAKFIENLKNDFYYSIESIKNRYPCKIVKVKNTESYNKKASVLYQAATKINIRESTVAEILSDPLLIEKFHPTDGIKLGFLSAGEILLKESNNLEEAREKYQKILKGMFANLYGDEKNGTE
ncbi:MAG: hypothetical protein JSR33_02680 [Proteobacteria bacterium]|nr:hypothetical protein [Pseudomonadota bacterium]